jgi:putative transposase
MSERPGIIDWPHAPPHRLTERGTYFVTAATHHREHHLRGANRLEVAQRGLITMAASYGWALEAWALFSNHYHFVAKSPPDPSNLSTMLSELHAKLGAWVNKLDQMPGRNVWHNFRETQLTHMTSYFARLNYTHGNAVHHGLVKVARDYPWCSAAWFEEGSSAAIVKSIRRFKTDNVHVEDDFEVASEW